MANKTAQKLTFFYVFITLVLCGFNSYNNHGFVIWHNESLGGVNPDSSFTQGLIGAFTYMFIHAGWIHFSLNIFTLYTLGKFIQERISGMTFLAIYFFGGFLSGLSVYFFGTGITIGASGAISTIYALVVYYNFKENLKDKYIYFAESSVFLAIGFIPSLPISATAHITGFAFGILFGFILNYHDKAKKDREEKENFRNQILLIK